jgi:hypothetical protein
MSDDDARIAAYEKFESWGVPATRRLHDQGRLPETVAPYGQAWLDGKGEGPPLEAAAQGEAPGAAPIPPADPPKRSPWSAAATFYAIASVAIVLGILGLNLLWRALATKILAAPH